MFGQITALLDYINSALKSMYEAWEDLLVTVDSKIAVYSSVSVSLHAFSLTHSIRHYLMTKQWVMS